MKKIRILVVDDAVVVRRVLTSVLSSDPELEVVGVAANGSIALAKIAQLQPDVVTLDMEMPDKDGLATLRELRPIYPALPVIMLSRYTERGAAATQDAILLGASDYVTMPSGSRDLAAAIRGIREQLIPKIKLLAQRGVKPRSLPADPKASLIASRWAARHVTHEPRRVDVVAIGVSTGGPDALAAILPKLSRDFPTPILIVQHMPAEFTRRLADRLRAKSVIGVSEAADNDLIYPGHAWVAPGSHHLVVTNERDQIRLRLSDAAPENFCRPSADVLFRSVAQVYGENVLAVVLTGLGQDGLKGCQAVREAGGQVLVQDQATSVVWGMPGLVAKAGLANQIVPLAQLATEITRHVESGVTV